MGKSVYGKLCVLLACVWLWRKHEKYSGKRRVRSSIVVADASHMYAIYWPVNTFDTDVPASLFHHHHYYYCHTIRNAF